MMISPSTFVRMHLFFQKYCFFFSSGIVKCVKFISNVVNFFNLLPFAALNLGKNPPSQCDQIKIAKCL